MKAFKFLLFLFFLSVTSFAQIRGEYCYSFDYDGLCIDLRDDSQFGYIHSSCTGVRKGFGTYTIQDSLLKLSFQSYHLPEITTTYLEEVEGLDSVEIQFHINVPDLDRAYDGVSGYLNNEDDHRRFHMSSHEGPDGLDRTVTVKSGSDTLEFTLNSWRSGRFKTYAIVPSHNQIIHINYFANNQIEEGEHKTFKINGISKDSIEIESLDYGEGFHWFQKRKAR